jgi:hypothetical protein
MALKAAKRQTLIMATKVAAEHAAQRGELSAKLTNGTANKVMQAIGISHGFSRVPYGFAVGELKAVWAKEYAASPKRKAITAQVKPSVAKPKARKQTPKPKASAKTANEAIVEQMHKDSEAVTITVTAEQRDLLVSLLTNA